MNIKNKEKVMQNLKKPSRKELTSVGRFAIFSGGAAMLIVAIRKIREKDWQWAVPLFMMGNVLAFSGVAGRNPLSLINRKSYKPLKVKTSVIIGKSRNEVYDFWRKFENLPNFMEHIKEVSVISDTKSHWIANLHSVDMSWDAEITEDKRGKVIAWKSLPGSMVKTEGRVEFKNASGHRGTELFVTFKYGDDTGELAKAFATLYRPIFSEQIKSELEKCKSLLESIEIPSFQAETKTTL